MRKITIIYFVVLSIVTMLTFLETTQTNVEAKKVQIYFVDKQMMKLVPMDYYINEKSTEKIANQILSIIINGKDDFDNIRRLIPREQDSMSVKVEKKCAVVNINSKYIEEYPKNRLFEELIVYQIVNSLTSIEDINTVRFLIDGKSEKKFLGFFDFREYFIPDYYV